MADSTAVFTFQDPFHDIPSTGSSFFVENPTLDPSKLILNNEQNFLNFDDYQMGREWDDLLDSEDPLSDPFIWAFCNGDNDVTGNSSGFPGDGNGINNNCNPPENLDSGDQSMALSVCSVPQYNCTFCQTLREITHTNGMSVKRLEIHGIFGVITHAVLGTYDFGSSLQPHELQMFDFQKESMQMVKRFLVQYFEACKQEGYSPMQDPLSTFYEALSVGLNEPDNNTNEFLQLSPEITGDCLYNQPEGGSNQGGSMKIPLAMQRERTRKLKLKDFADYFDLPIEDAARKMNICPTVVKKICRKHGVLRWPYRKIRSIERKISKLVKILDASNNEDKAQALQDIQKHQQELTRIYEVFTK